MFTLFLGAGFSKWAAGLPVASELFDFSIEPFGEREKAKLNIIHHMKNIWDIENPKGLSEQFIASAMSGSQIQRDALLWYVTRRLTDQFIWNEWHAGKMRRHVLMIDENRKNNLLGVIRTRAFILKRIADLSGIITTNYDLIIEYALGTKYFNYGQKGEVLQGRGAYPLSQWQNPVTLKGSTVLTKLHGSISWGLDGQRYTDGRGGITGNALIIAPTPEKKIPDKLIFEWELASGLLRKSETILVFGFAFNPYDEAIKNLLMQHGNNIKKVIVVDKHKWSDRVSAIWPNAQIHFICPPTEDRNDMVDWFKNLDQIINGSPNSSNYEIEE